MKSLALTFLVTAALAAQTISGERIRAHVRFLASDLLEGRGVGARGGNLATEYIATQFALAGAKPAGENGSYFQRVPLVGVRTLDDARMTGAAGGKTVPLKWLDDFVGLDRRQRAVTEIEADAVFAGHGIVAPEYEWDDFKNVDVRGKILVLFTNEPTTNPKLFQGRALTYYGRWTYKFEQALRKGALGAILIHTPATAGYGWDVVRNSWGREEPYVKLPGDAAELAFTGWVTEAAGQQLLAASGRTVAELIEASESPSFRPFPLDVRIRVALRSRIRELNTRNVAAIIPGDESQEAVIYSAHWDHLGVGAPINGDSIYNGAVDNATGCGVLLELARAWGALPRKPRRSALFLALTAEEGGLRGSEFYAGHPLIAPGKTAAAFNYDGVMPFGRTKDLVLTGAERTTLWPLVQSVAARLTLSIQPDSRPEQGLFYRSDHFSFAKAGIPAFSIKNGNEFAGKSKEYGDEVFRKYNAERYHRPSDEYQEDWDFSGLEQLAQFGFILGTETANMTPLATWVKGDEFLAAREKSLGW